MKRGEVVDEVIPRRPRPIPLDPCPVVMPCRACGRHTNEWLTWAEVHRLYDPTGLSSRAPSRHEIETFDPTIRLQGRARVACLTCLLTDVPRTATIL